MDWSKYDREERLWKTYSLQIKKAKRCNANDDHMNEAKYMSAAYFALSHQRRLHGDGFKAEKHLIFAKAELAIFFLYRDYKGGVK
jgi:hypothetical protein